MIRFIITVSCSALIGAFLVTMHRQSDVPLISSILIAIFCLIAGAILGLQKKNADREDAIGLRKLLSDPSLLQEKRQNIVENLSILEATQELQRMVFEASTDLVSCIDEQDARQRFSSTLSMYWSFTSCDLFIWQRGSWRSLGGPASGDEPILAGPVQLPDSTDTVHDLTLDLSPAVDGQAAVVLRYAQCQPTISDHSLDDQRYVAEVLRGQLALSLRRVTLYHQLQELGRIDPLTTTMRRWYGMQRLDELIESDNSLALAMVDIDFFKAVNDNFGHSAGDVVLKSVGTILQKSLRTGDITCRYGGEEFMILLPNTSPHSALQVCERLRASVASLADLPCSVTVSIGLASCLIDDDHESLLTRADTALYEAKEKGRNQVIQSSVQTEPEDHIRTLTKMIRSKKKKDNS